MIHDFNNLEHAHQQINALRERARLDTMICEAQPAFVARPLHARVALMLRRLFPKGASSLPATKASTDRTEGLLILPNLIVSDFDLQIPQQSNHKLL
jgi:hypothetical protein